MWLRIIEIEKEREREKLTHRYLEEKYTNQNIGYSKGTIAFFPFLPETETMASVIRKALTLFSLSISIWSIHILSMMKGDGLRAEQRVYKGK